MKKLFLILIFSFLISDLIIAQQLPSNNQYLINPYSLSPSFAGLDAKGEGYLSYRKDWMNIESAPELKMLSINTALSQKVGVGINIMNDKTDIFSNIFASLSYAYHLKLAESQYLSLNISAGVIQKKIDLESVIIKHEGDPIFYDMEKQNGVSFFAGAGVLYRFQNLDIGFNIPSLWESKPDFGEENKFKDALSRHYIVHASYNVKLNDDWRIKPFAIVRQTELAPMSYEVAAIVGYKDQVWVGGTYRKYGIIGLNLGGVLTKTVRFNYSYEFSNQGILSESAGTHEITVGLRIGGGNGISGDFEGFQSPRESQLNSKLESLETTTARLERELKELKNSSAKSELSSTEKELFEDKIETLENRINNIQTNMDSSGSILTEYGPDFIKGKEFYVVFGAFMYKKNANRWSVKLKGQGYSPTSFYNKKRKLYYVYLYKTDNWQQAINKKEEFKGKGLTKVWIHFN